MLASIRLDLQRRRIFVGQVTGKAHLDTQNKRKELKNSFQSGGRIQKGVLM
jgi:translation initiation factor 1 (eIF-1/SUI1)